MQYVDHDLLDDPRRGPSKPRQVGLLATWGIVVAVSLGLAWLIAKGVPAP